jgi:AcrR family transcriptional regulator
MDGIMAERRRLTGGARRESILKAARRVFAENGFRGTTTRALAEAAGVSEALLFQHFPSKEALFAAMQATFIPEQDSSDSREMMDMAPSTATLVRIVHWFYSSLIDEQNPLAKGEIAILARLMFRSLTEDGAFARMFMSRVPSRLVAKIEECIPPAIAAGDLRDRHLPDKLPGWFTHHLGVILMLNQLPKPSVIDYGVPRSTLVEEAVRFALRGIGLSEEAIGRYYQPERWSKTRR